MSVVLNLRLTGSVKYVLLHKTRFKELVKKLR